MATQTDLAPSWDWTERDVPELSDDQADELSLIETVERLAQQEDNEVFFIRALQEEEYYHFKPEDAPWNQEEVAA